VIQSIKVQLKPNNKQSSLLFQCAGVARWAYNWTLDRQQKIYENGGTFISNNELRKELTQLKKTDELKWLKNYSNNITKQAIKDACDAYEKFFKIAKKRYSYKAISRVRGCNTELTYKDLEGYPNFKSKKGSRPAFYQDNVKIKFTRTHVKIEKLGKIKLAEYGRIPVEGKYFNPRITFDQLNWSISVGIEIDHKTLNQPISEPLGIDVGINALAVISTGKVYKNINKTKVVKKVNKKLKRLQKQLGRQYEKNIQSKNRLKTQEKIKKARERIDNIRTNYTHQITTSLVKNKPAYIVIEELNIKKIMRNKALSKDFAELKLHEFRRQLEYKCLWYNISFIMAAQWYPSSKTCSRCGRVKHRLTLSERVYRCECGYVIDRDLNASINLREYPRLAKVI